MSVIAGYAPVIASSPGQIGADTKAYLYLDPSGVLANAVSLWDADRALGTVTHQSIGYLWPMGPFYWVFDTIGLPDWMAQRLWLGSLLTAAGLGVLYLLRTLGWERRGLLIAVLAYQLSPYLLHYSARISAVLMPWAALGWMIALTVKSGRVGGWRYPALFALTALTAGSMNATSLLLVGLAPALWLAHASLVERSISVKRAVGTAARIAVLTVAVSLWWIAGLAMQALHSLPVTRYTETYEVVADAATAPEILRGLGYWFFYGNDKFGPWIVPSVEYTQGLWLLFLSFGLVVGALGLAALLRWRHRGYFLLLFAVGALVGVGAHPFDSPSLAGGWFSAFTRSDAGLALRSTPRAGPLIALATAVLAAAGVQALTRQMPRFGALVSVAVLIAVVLNNPAIWRVRMLEEHLQRPENLPEYWLEAADALDDAARVWEIPGSDFASYRWGNTVDPITPALIEGEYVARELVPFGSAASAALIGAVDRRMQEGVLEGESLAAVARLMGVDRIVHRGDLTFERFRTPRPVETAELLDRAPGLTLAAVFGDATPNEAGPEQTMIDETHLARSSTPDHRSPVSVYAVERPRRATGTRSLSGATVLIGDADGIVDSAAAGVLDFTDASAVFFAADLAASDELFETVTASPAEIVLTDSNRRRAQRWGTLRENRGHTEMAGEEPLRYDPTDNRLPAFDTDAEAVDSTRTVSEQRGPLTVQASAYGNPVTYTNDDRPFHAVDGSLETAWTVAAFAEPRGEYLRLSLPEPTILQQVRLVQPLGSANRRITQVDIRVDDQPARTATLDERSLSAAGQTIDLNTKGTVVEIEITETDMPRRATYPGVDPVGFAEVDLGLAPVTEVIRVPRALTDRLDAHLADHSLSVVLTRERSDPREPVRVDPEPRMLRAVPLPISRSATLTGTARLSAHAPSELIDELLASTSDDDGARIAASSSGRLPGDLASRASKTLDGDPATAWTPLFGPQRGQWIELRLDEPTDFDHIEVDVVTDRLHSVPAAFAVTVDGNAVAVSNTGLALSDDPLDSTTTVTLPVQSRGATLRLTIVEAVERRTRDWYSNTMQPLPVSIAEVRLGPHVGSERGRLAAASSVDSGCRDDLVSLNGEPLRVRVTGSADDAEARRRLDLAGCDPVTLRAGETLLETASGAITGIDVDQIVLWSPADAPVSVAETADTSRVVRHSDTRHDIDLAGSSSDRWVVLGQSHNRGWRAFADGSDLGEPVLIDGYANGWLVSSESATRVRFEWQPQRWVHRALLASAACVALAALLAWRGRREHREPRPSPKPGLGPSDASMGLTLLEPAKHAPPSAVATAAVGLSMTAAATLTLPQWPQWLALAVIIGVTASAATRWRRGGELVLAAAALSLAAAAAWIMVEQRRSRHPPDFSWPQQFEEVHILGMITILLVLAGYARDAAAARARGPSEAASKSE